MTISQQKQQTRAEMKSLLNESSLEYLNTFSSKINSELFKLIRTNNWRSIGLFAPLKNEPNIWPIFEELIVNEKKGNQFHFYFPRIALKTNKVEMIEISSHDQLVKGSYSILEPRTELLRVNPSILDVIFIPGVAFDQRGNRLGRGNGYYDKFLATTPKTVTKVGICFPFQVIDLVPSDKNDQSMNLIVY